VPTLSVVVSPRYSPPMIYAVALFVTVLQPFYAASATSKTVSVGTNLHRNNVSFITFSYDEL
jgi:hypothetical protein